MLLPWESKEGKTEKIKLEDVKSSIENRVAVRKDKGNERIVGYAYLNDETLVALVEKKLNLLIIILPLFGGNRGVKIGVEHRDFEF